MSENISLIMGMKFAGSLNMGENLRWILYMIAYKSGAKINISYTR